MYKLHLLTRSDITFLLTKGGHNAGIVSEPGHPGRHYRVAVKRADADYVDPKAWFAAAALKQGSWWPEWTTWLAAHSGASVTPPAMGAPRAGYGALVDAPGTYVLQE